MGKKKRKAYHSSGKSKSVVSPSFREEKPYTDGVVSFLNKYGLYILLVFVLIYILVYGYTSYMKYETFSYYDFDLAIYNQVTWNTLHGNFMYSSIRENVYLKDGGPQRIGIYFKDHAPIILLFFLPIYAIFQGPLTLLMLQTVFLGAAAIPLFLIAKRELHGGWGLAFGLVYLLYPAVGYINLFEFHPLCFAPFFLFFAFYFYRLERFRPFIAFLALAMFCKEEVAITVFMFGIYVLIDRARKRELFTNKKWVITPIVMGLFWAVLTYKILAPMFNEKGYIYGDLFKEMGGSFGGIVKKVLTDPIYVIKHIFMIQEPMLNRPLFLVKLFLPLAFLSFLSPLTLLITVPQLFLYLASSKAATSTIYFQYTGAVIPILFISAIMGARFLNERVRLRSYWPVPAAVLLIVGIVASLAWGPQFKVLNKNWDYIGANTLYGYNRVHTSDYRDDMKQHLVDLIPKDSSVATTFRFLDKLSSRRHIYSLHYIFLGREMVTQIKYATPSDIEYVLLDYSESWFFNQLMANSNPNAMQDFVLDPARKYGVEKIIDGFVLLKEDRDDLTPLYEVLDKQPVPENKIGVPIEFNLGQPKPFKFIGLLGTDTKLVETNGFKQVEVTSYWQSINPAPVVRGTPAPMTMYLAIAVFEGSDLRNKEPLLVRNYPICYEIYPAERWKKDEFVKSKHYISLPDDISSGGYTVAIQPVPKNPFFQKGYRSGLYPAGEIQIQSKD